MKVTVVHIVLLLLLIAAAQLVAGVYLLAGTGWAVVATSFSTLGFAMLLSRGLTNG